jgi:hypothetical protein
VGEERNDVDLCVPEVVALIAAAGDALGRHAEALGAGGRLHELEEVEADRLLDVRGAVDLDVRAAPERLDLGGVILLDAVIAGRGGTVERAVDAREQVAVGRLRGPVVGDELRQPQRLAHPERGLDDEAGAVVLGARAGGHVGVMGHPARQLQPAVARHQLQQRAAAVGARSDRRQHLLREALAAARIVPGLLGRVRDQLRRDRDARRRVERDDLVVERREMPIRQRCQPARAHQQPLPARSLELDLPHQHPDPHVEHALKAEHTRRREIERLVVDEQPDWRPVRRRGDRLPGTRQPERVFRIDDRPRLVKATEDHARIVRRRALLGRAAHSEIAVADREH